MQFARIPPPFRRAAEQTYTSPLRRP
jgi:hypothetical protein